MKSIKTISAFILEHKIESLRGGAESWTRRKTKQSFRQMLPVKRTIKHSSSTANKLLKYVIVLFTLSVLEIHFPLKNWKKKSDSLCLIDFVTVWSSVLTAHKGRVTAWYLNSLHCKYSAHDGAGRSSPAVPGRKNYRACGVALGQGVYKMTMHTEIPLTSTPRHHQAQNPSVVSAWLLSANILDKAEVETRRAHCRIICKGNNCLSAYPHLSIPGEDRQQAEHITCSSRTQWK
jgi:hypothetical protein